MYVIFGGGWEGGLWCFVFFNDTEEQDYDITCIEVTVFVNWFVYIKCSLRKTTHNGVNCVYL